jgi:hypothetical protein
MKGTPRLNDSINLFFFVISPSLGDRLGKHLHSVFSQIKKKRKKIYKITLGSQNHLAKIPSLGTQKEILQYWLPVLKQLADHLVNLADQLVNLADQLVNLADHLVNLADHLVNLADHLFSDDINTYLS